MIGFRLDLKREKQDGQDRLRRQNRLESIYAMVGFNKN